MRRVRAPPRVARQLAEPEGLGAANLSLCDTHLYS
jgi:hypothetical protein